MSITATSALEWAESLRRKDYSCLELTQSVISHIEQYEPALNALTLRTFEQALDRARVFDQQQDYSAMFGGVPWLMKDMVDVPNVPRSDGGHVALQRQSPQVSEFMQAVNKGGLNLLGMTNVPEFASSVHTQNERFGTTVNPWASQWSPSGSSGGSAVAVAAGYVPMVHATCGAGSIRLPASYCGVFGYKPSRGQNLCAELNGEHDLIKHHHVLTRCVKDSAAFLDLVSSQPNCNFLDLSSAKDKSLCIAVDVGGLQGLKPEPLQMAAMEHAKKTLMDMGHKVVEWPAWPVVADEFLHHLGNVFMTRMPHLIKMVEQATGQPFENNPWLGHFSTTFAMQSRVLKGGELNLAREYFDRVRRDVEAKMGAESVDLVMSPVQALDQLAPEHFDSSHHYLDEVKGLNEFMSYTMLANATGAPAMSVPLYWPDNHHPLGTHFYGFKGQDHVLMRLAFALEQANPWQQHYTRVNQP